MKTWILVVVAVVAIVLASATVVQAGPPGYLGKYMPDEPVVFSWQINVPSSPLWALYQINGDGSYRGMYRCFGCFEQLIPGEWTSDLAAPDAGEYMICANVAGDLQTIHAWTFRVDGRGGKPVRVPSDLTECP